MEENTDVFKISKLVQLLVCKKNKINKKVRMSARS